MGLFHPAPPQPQERRRVPLDAPSSDDRFATVTLTGGGVLVESHSTDRQPVGTLTGGGVIVETHSSDRNSATILTGGGVLVESHSKTGQFSVVLTGGGVLSEVHTTNRNVVVVLTGGGVLMYAYTVGEDHTAFVSLTGGGSFTESHSTDRDATATLTGGGILGVVISTDRSSVVVLTGGGVLTVLYSVPTVVYFWQGTLWAAAAAHAPLPDPSSFAGPMNQWQAEGAWGGGFRVRGQWQAFGHHVAPLGLDTDADDLTPMLPIDSGADKVNEEVLV